MATLSQMIGSGIEWIRREKGLIQRQLAERAGMPASTLMGIENGKGASFQKIEAIARAFGIRPSGLVQIAEELHNFRSPSADFYVGDDRVAALIAKIRKGA